MKSRQLVYLCEKVGKQKRILIRGEVFFSSLNRRWSVKAPTLLFSDWTHTKKGKEEGEPVLQNGIFRLSWEKEEEEERKNT